MKSEESATSVTKSFIEAINQSYSHLFRTLIFFLLLFAALVAALVLFLKSITQSAELKAEFNNDGRLILEMKKSGLFSTEKKSSFVTFLLPSNQVWFDTGLELKPDQECYFKITGTVHLAIHSIVKYSEVDKKNPIPWTDAKGNKWADVGDISTQLNAKKQLLLKPGETIGNVLGYYLPINETVDFKKYFIQNRQAVTPKIFEINNEKTIANNNDKNVKIYLSVNDILLNFDSAFIKTSETAYRGIEKKWLPNWNNLKATGYENLYFDDNVGNFLVQVEIREKEK